MVKIGLPEIRKLTAFPNILKQIYILKQTWQQNWLYLYICSNKYENLEEIETFLENESSQNFPRKN